MTGKPAFEVEAALTPAEMQTALELDQAFMRDSVPPTSAVLDTLAILLLVVAATAVGVFVHLVRPEDAWALALLLLLTFAAGAWTMLRWTWRSYRRGQAALNERAVFLREPRRYRIGEAGIDVLGATADAHWRWPAFTRAEIARGLLVIRADVSRSVILPTRAFRNQTESEAALAIIRERIAAARG